MLDKKAQISVNLNEKVEIFRKKAEKIKNYVNIVPRLKLIVNFLNPYKNLRENEKTSTILYKQLVKWLINILLNGFLISFVFIVLSGYYLKITDILTFAFFEKTLAFGISLWIICMLVNKTWDKYVEGKSKIASSYPTIKLR